MPVGGVVLVGYLRDPDFARIVADNVESRCTVADLGAGRRGRRGHAATVSTAGRDWPPPPQAIVAYFDARAEGYDHSAMHRWAAARTVDALTLTPGMTVLDAAAGTGLAAREVSRRLRGEVTVVAADLSGQLLQVACGALAGLLPVRADVARLPLSSGSVDLVVCVAAAAYFPRPQRVFGEFHRVLRPGGTLGLQTWAADTLTVGRLLRAAAAAAGVALTDPNATLGSPARVGDALARAGFAAVTTTADTWTEPLPDPRSAWDGLLGGILGAPLWALPGDVLAQLGRDFDERLRAARARHEQDQQAALFTTATTPDPEPAAP